MTVSTELEYEGDISFDYEKIIKEIVDAALRYEACPYECEIGVLLTDDEEIKHLNQEFRGMDRSTDVLSFPLIEYENAAVFDRIEDDIASFDLENGELMLGDIVISVDHVYKQAELYGHSIEREFAFLLAHSMLHLMGYDHIDDNEREEMEKRQEAILESVGYTREASKL